MDYQPSYGFLKDCLYRSESYKVTLADAYRQSTMRERGGDSPQGRLQVGEYSRHCLANLRIE